MDHTSYCLRQVLSNPCSLSALIQCSFHFNSFYPMCSISYLKMFHKSIVFYHNFQFVYIFFIMFIICIQKATHEGKSMAAFLSFAPFTNANDYYFNIYSVPEFTLTRSIISSRIISFSNCTALFFLFSEALQYLHVSSPHIHAYDLEPFSSCLFFLFPDLLCGIVLNAVHIMIEM